MKVEKLVRSCINAIPPYVPGKPIEEVERELKISGIIKMASNENPLGPSNEVRLAIAQAIDKVALYPDANCYYLKEALASDLGVSPDQLLVGNGSDEVNKIVGETFLKPTDEVIIPQPTFSQYEYITYLMDAKPVFVAGDGLRHDLNGMLAAITKKTKLIFVCNPNNPTGTIVKNLELIEFIEKVPPQILVVIDEAYSDFADDPHYPNGLKLLREGRNNLIIYRTFSKIHGMAGLRLGYAIAAPAVIAQMHKTKEPFDVNLVAQTAGIAALNSKKHIQLSKELVQSGRKTFYQELDELNLEYLPTQANFILINCKRDSQELYQYLLQNGIIVRPTHTFGLPNWIRVTFGTTQQNEQFFRVFRTWVKRQESLAG